MGKVKFSARKDPLLRVPPSATPAPSGAPRPENDGLSTSRPKGASSARESPAGVVALDPPELEQAPPHKPKAITEPDPPDERDRPAQPRRHPVQTSVSLPPDVWDTLDDLAAAASNSTGKLLVAILAAAIPDTPAAAFTTVEQMLLSQSPDDTLHEERNYRLPADLRTRLDDLAAALGGGARGQRSLLVRAILTAHAPATATHAHELLTQRHVGQLQQRVSRIDSVDIAG